MPVLLDDAAIAELIEEKKEIDLAQLRGLPSRMKRKRGHLEAHLDVCGADGNRFQVMLRKSSHNAMDFSAILALLPKGTNTVFRLRRYNGNSHTHVNQVEGQVLDGFHVHKATLRYQERGGKEDAYAETNSKYVSIEQALELMIMECGFVAPPPPPMPLFDKRGEQ
jgi:hypothetical protein